MPCRTWFDRLKVHQKIDPRRKMNAVLSDPLLLPYRTQNKRMVRSLCDTGSSVVLGTFANEYEPKIVS